MALRTTVVGSWWKLDEHEAELARYHRGELTPEAGEDLLNRAAAAAIGVASVLLGEADDAPGRVLFGCPLVLGTLALTVRTALRSE